MTSAEAAIYGCLACRFGTLILRQIFLDSWPFQVYISHRIHGTGIFTYIYHRSHPNVGKSTMHECYGILIHLFSRFANHMIFRFVSWFLGRFLSSRRSCIIQAKWCELSTTLSYYCSKKTLSFYFQKIIGPCDPSVQENCNTPLEHTPGNPPSQLWKECLHSLLVKGLGVCSKGTLGLQSLFLPLKITLLFSTPFYLSNVEILKYCWLPSLYTAWFLLGILIWATKKKNLSTFHYTDWFIGILIMAYYNPYIIG